MGCCVFRSHRADDETSGQKPAANRPKPRDADGLDLGAWRVAGGLGAQSLLLPAPLNELKALESKWRLDDGLEMTAPPIMIKRRR